MITLAYDTESFDVELIVFIKILYKLMAVDGLDLLPNLGPALLDGA
jgi:hypothetical protein